MLTHVYIRNFGLIHEADIDLEKGLNIISGETGTGKSMVVQAVNVALGGRAGRTLVEKDSAKALVQLVFTADEGERKKLERYFSDGDENEIILTREITRSGRSLARINGEIVKLSELAEAAGALADIHGQYDNQFFLNTDRHTDILDSFAGSSIAPLKEKMADSYRQFAEKRSALVRLRRDMSEYNRERDFMRYELDEIEAANIKEGEDEELEERSRVLANSEKIYSALSKCYEILYNSGIDKCTSLLTSISSYSETYKDLCSQITECSYTLADIQQEIRDARDSAELAPGELDQVMMRMDLLDGLKRKYGGTLESVIARRDECRRALELSENSEELDKKLTDEYRDARDRALKAAGELSAGRRKAAARLEKLMTAELADLNFNNAKFTVKFTEKENKNGKPVLSASGTDRAEFLFSANKGMEPGPLADIASGGEISRVSLAFKSVTSETDHTGTLVFDEIDTGISGRTASVVASKMRSIAERHQIICITHLPQIAAAGDAQYLISKDEDGRGSFTTITPLDHDGRVTEIARLLGGTNVTETTLKSAEELIEAAHGAAG